MIKIDKVVKFERFHETSTSYDNMINCYGQCHGGINPSEIILTPGHNGFRRIVNYADAILFRGCFRGQASCHGPLDGLQTKLEAESYSS